MLDIPGFDDALGPCRTLLLTFGAWPDPDTSETILVTCRFLFVSLTMFLFAVYAQTAMLVQVLHDLNSVIAILTIDDIPMTISIVKFVSVWYNKNVLKSLVILMREDWLKVHTDQDTATMWENAKFSRNLSIVCIILGQGVAVGQLFMAVVLTTQEEEGDRRQEYLLSDFPYDTQVSPNYEITFIGQMLSTVFGALTYCAVDGFFAVLVMHLSGQFIILSRGVSKLINEYELVEPCNYDFSRRFADIVNRHDDLNRFAKTIDDSFNVIFLIQMMASAFALCLQGYELVVMMTNEGGIPILQLIHMINFTCCFSFSLFVYCYVAEELRTSSTQLDLETYKTRWYKLPPKETKILLFLMRRSRKPLAITAGKFCEFSLELYCSILKSSGGYLSMLLAMRDRLT